MDTKSLRVEIKDADKGEVRAVFSTLDVIDSDGDITLAGAFDGGAPVRISAYNHTSWGGALPVGKGLIHADDKEAVLEGQFFLNTQAGRDTFETVKQMGGLQEWSYGFDVVDSEFGERDGKRVRFLKKLKVYEVSPVLLGAGIGTRTLVAKSRGVAGLIPATKRAIPAHETTVVSRSWDEVKTAGGFPAEVRPSQLRTVFAWVDPDGDPEDVSSYKLAHHHGVDGPANLRACLTGIAALNSVKDIEIPDTDRKAVYEHLAAHIRDADREPPELRDRGTGATKFNDELLEGLATVSGLIDAASRVVALRRVKGKGLSKGNAEILDWISDDLGRLKALLSHPVADDEPQPTDEEIASVVAASIARIHGI